MIINTSLYAIMISKKVDLMGNFTFFRDVFFGLLIFFIFTVPDYLISVPVALPCIQFCAYTILLSLTRVALFVYLLLFYIEKILKKRLYKIQTREANRKFTVVFSCIIDSTFSNCVIFHFRKGQIYRKL